MDRYTVDNDLFPLRPSLLVNVHILYPFQRAPFLGSVDHLSKDSILAIKMTGLFECDKELASIRPRPLVCHRDDTSGIVSQSGYLDLIFKILTPNRRATFDDGDVEIPPRRKGSIPALHHETRNNAMEGCFVVRTRRAESKEILGSFRDRFAEYLKLDVSVGGMKLEVYGKRAWRSKY